MLNKSYVATQPESPYGGITCDACAAITIYSTTRRGQSWSQGSHKCAGPMRVMSDAEVWAFMKNNDLSYLRTAFGAAPI